MSDAVLDWLLAGDPSIRWQTMRDVMGAADRKVRGEQQQVMKTGWGARLLALQDGKNKWGGGIYSPKWTSTTYTLLLLRGLGLPAEHPQALRACRVLLDAGFYSDGGINFSPKSYQRSEPCTGGMVVALGSWFRLDDPRVDRIAGYLLEQQMADGGWNCEATPGYGCATHASFHTTILVLEALLEYQRFRGSAAAAEAAIRGREFLMQHRLFRSHRTGAIINPAWTRFSFPARWHYDVMRGLDYFRDCGAARDERLGDAIELLRRKRRSDGRWLLQNRHPGRTFFEMEQPGRPSRWNTLRGLRILQWWESGASLTEESRSHTRRSIRETR